MSASSAPRTSTPLFTLALAAALVLPAAVPGEQNPGAQNPGAQNPGAQNPGAQNPGAQDPQPTAPQEPGQAPRLIQRGDEIVFSMSETAGMELKEFIKWAQELTDKRFVLNDQELQSVQGNVSFLGTYTFKRETFARDFFSFFQMMLYIKQFALLSRGSGDLEIYEIVFMGGTRRSEVVSGARLVDPEHVAEYKNQTGVPILTTVPLRNINATVAQNALRPFFAQGAQGAAPTGLTFGTAGNNTSLLLQGFGPQVYDAVTLLQLVDKPIEAPELSIQVHRLEHAAPEELQPILDELLESRTRIRQAALTESGVGASGAAQQGGQTQQVKVVTNPALRAIILSGTPDQVREALELVARLDIPPEPIDGSANVIKLKNVLAEELRTTLDQFTRDDLQAEQQAQQGQGGAQGATVRRPRRTVIQAHKESNSLLVSASATKYQQILQLIDQLDQRQDQVLIEAAIVELTTGAAARWGIELGLIDIKEDGDFTRPFGFTHFGQSAFQDLDDDGIPDTRLPDFDNPLQGLTGGIISGGDFAVPVLINALATDDRANILSVPSVMVNNNSPATVITEEERPTLESTQGTATTQQSSGTPRTAGITLQISPTISPNNYLRLNINLEVSRFVGAFDPNSPTGGGIVLRRTVTTEVTMPSGDTMVIGGVVEDSESYVDRGVPFLKDIPLLGWLFRASESSSNKTNMYVFVTPTILDEDDFNDLWQLSLQKKMEAERYIGTRRIRLIDRKWVGSDAAQARTLEDAGTTVDDIDRAGENELPIYQRPDREIKPAPAPSGPPVPGTSGTTGTTQK